MSITLRDITRWKLRLKECIPQYANPQADDFQGGAEETMWSVTPQSGTPNWSSLVHPQVQEIRSRAEFPVDYPSIF